MHPRSVHATGILLENGGRYAITIKSREPHWYDRGIETSSSRIQ